MADEMEEGAVRVAADAGVAAKAALRARLRAAREALPAAERAQADAAIAARARALPELAGADLVLAYLSFGAEVDTRALIAWAWDAGKRVALPCCVPGTRALDWYITDSFEGLVRCRFGMDEPAPDSARALDPSQAGPRAVALVPGLAFDRRGFRIGYGGGFYDRFLAAFPGVSVGLCRDAALLPALPGLEPHDQPVAAVVTESEVLRPGRPGSDAL